jgi:hypothetical protein
MVFNTTFNNISVILMWWFNKEGGVMVFNTTFNTISVILTWWFNKEGRVMVFNATFNNISVISWLSVLLVEKTTDLSQVTDKVYHIVLY